MSSRPCLPASRPLGVTLAALALLAGLNGGATPALAITALPVLTQVGPIAGSQLGLFVSAVGDFNGDGWPDFVVGAPFANGGGSSRGEAWLYWGGPGLDATPDLVLRGEANYDQFGICARGCGDVNGDGWNDLVVGAPNNDSVGNNSGRAYVFFGGPTPDATADLVLIGEAANDQFGWSVAGPGDLDGGGPDFVVGAPGAQSAAGRAYVFRGGAALDATADFVIQGPAGVRLGWFMDRAGDFDADGWPDLLVGANTSINAWLYRGGPTFDATADFVFTGEASDDRFGYGLAAAGDVNGDGYDDVIIGGMHNDTGGYDAGRAYLYYGGPAPNTVADLIFTGTDYRGIFGRTVAGAGDLNADGYDDLLIGAPTPDFAGLGPGRMFVFLGGDPLGAHPPDAVPDLILTGENESDRLGSQLSMVGDINGDGRDEFAVGANLFDAPSRVNAGKFYLYRIHKEAPVAVADTATVLEDTAVQIAVLANDHDLDGTLLVASVRVTAPPAHGAAVVDTLTGIVTYTPAPDWFGADAFSYDVRDNEQVLSDAAVVTITVEPVNDRPVALADTFAVDENVSLVVAAPGLLANDTDIDGDPLTAQAALVPRHGALTLAADGGFTYLPEPQFAGADSFAYLAFDGVAWSDTARVRLTVRPVNAPPVALADTFAVDENVSLVVAAPGLLANDTDIDGDPLTAQAALAPRHGALTLAADGGFTYLPEPQFAGADSFAYLAFDGVAWSDTARVRLTVRPANDPPIALDDTASTPQDSTVSVPVLANDSDPDGALDPASLTITVAPGHGTALVDTLAGAVAYTPGPGFAGVDTLVYTVADLDGAVSNPARVVITVLDTSPPGAVTALAAAPGPGFVALSWTDVPADADSLEVWRALWRDGTGLSAYPRYDDAPGSTPPTRPADRAAALADTLWTRAARLPAAAVAFTDTLPTRGVYHYELFARDAAGNWGPRANAGPRATSYRLGDLAVPHDGLVDAADLALLNTGYGKAFGDTAFAPEADLGPTDDSSGAGVPLTDGRLDFEDVMIAALNFGPPAVGPTPAGQVLLAWRRVDETVWALRLDIPNPSLKGLRLTADLPPGVTATVTPGPLLALQAAPAFLRNAHSGQLDVALVVLGGGAGLEGAGELLRVTLSAYVPLDPPTVLARAVDNSPLPHLIQTTTGVPAAPAFALAQNCPNPFNPATTIRFALPAAGPVRLAIFDARGRRVAALVEGELDAGDHAILWRGCDDRGAPVGSGTYLYRLEAGARVETRRMTLVR